jgi:ubiquitin C-terminal hydrolase
MLEAVYLNDYSEIMDMFYGIYVSVIVSKDTNEIQTIKPESFFVLDLHIDNNIETPQTLYNCLDTYVKPEILEGDCAWYNEKTGKKEDIKKQIQFWNFPQIVIITINRFTPDGTSKVNKNVIFPLDDLNLSKYVCGYKPATYQYELYGICNHIGGVTGGHYTAFIRNVENKWLHFNDRIVESVDNPNDVISPAAYCLFYRKKNNTV